MINSIKVASSSAEPVSITWAAVRHTVHESLAHLHTSNAATMFDQINFVYSGRGTTVQMLAESCLNRRRRRHGRNLSFINFLSRYAVQHQWPTWLSILNIDTGRKCALLCRNQNREVIIRSNEVIIRRSSTTEWACASGWFAGTVQNTVRPS